MTTPLRVLLVEDSPTDAKLVLRELARSGRPIESRRVDTAPDMREALASQTWDVVLSDWSMPTFSALEALEVLRSAEKDVPFIIVSGTVGEDTAVRGIKSGASDYLLKDRLTRLMPAIDRELSARESRAARVRAEEALRRTEEQLRHAQKMEAIGILAGGVAHDFNNLLSVILSYSSMMESDLTPGDPMLEPVTEIKLAGERAAALTRQLLAFSRRQLLRPRLLNLNEVVAQTESMLRRLIGEDVELIKKTAPALPHILVDPDQIGQVIMNLAVNARDAMPGGGKLTIETGEAMLDDEYVAGHLGQAVGPHVMLAVTDTGSGMDKETQARVFEPFFTTKDAGEGTGLGLSTVFGIVKQSGGVIWVYSEVGKGTAFRIYFPIADATKRDASIDVPMTTRLEGSETILLVEDEERVRHLACIVLRRYGYNVLEAAGGGDALLICEQHPATIHLLVTDVVMPRMSGRQLAERLQPIRPHMKVLYMSGYTANAIVTHGVVDSDVFFVQKPITPETLAAAVRRTLDAAARHGSPSQP